MRNDGSASTVSIRRPMTFEPGKGTNASTIARKVPRIRHPSVDVAAIETVRHRASRNTSEVRTPAQVDAPPPALLGDSDSRLTRISGYTTATTTINNGGTTHHAANDRGGGGFCGAVAAGSSSVVVMTRPAPGRLPARGTALRPHYRVRIGCPGRRCR